MAASTQFCDFFFQLNVCIKTVTVTIKGTIIITDTQKRLTESLLFYSLDGTDKLVVTINILIFYKKESTAEIRDSFRLVD